jgi:membrane protein implicated in regulation of membrane protease activity
MTRKSYTVVSAYTGRDGKTRVYVKDHPLPLLCEEPLNEGDAVVIVGQKAERAR